MSKPDVFDVRFSSSSFDDFFAPKADPGPSVRSASAGARHRVASLHQLAGFSMVAEDTLVRVSQKDFWKLGQDTEGFYIERLVSDEDGPVKG